MDVPLWGEKSGSNVFNEIAIGLVVGYLSVPEVLQSEFVCEFARRHGLGKVLLVGEHQQVGVA